MHDANDTAPPRLWDESHTGTLLGRALRVLRPQHTFFAGVAANDPRVRVLCTERLGTGLAQVAEEACAGGLASLRSPHVPRLHRTQSPELEQAASSHYTMADGLRKNLLEKFQKDALLYARHCGKARLPQGR